MTACNPDIPGFTISDSGSGESFKTQILFDSGTPTMEFSIPPKSTFPKSLARGSTETLTLAGLPFTYSYQVDKSLPFITTLFDYAQSPRTIIGVGFFTDHRMYNDFGSNREGWK